MLKDDIITIREGAEASCRAKMLLMNTGNNGMMHHYANLASNLEQLASRIENGEILQNIMQQCQKCGCPMYHAPKRGGWYCPECRLLDYERALAQIADTIPAARQTTPVSYLQSIARNALKSD